MIDQWNLLFVTKSDCEKVRFFAKSVTKIKPFPCISPLNDDY